MFFIRAKGARHGNVSASTDDRLKKAVYKLQTNLKVRTVHHSSVYSSFRLITWCFTSIRGQR